MEEVRVRVSTEFYINTEYLDEEYIDIENYVKDMAIKIVKSEPDFCNFEVEILEEKEGE